MIVTKFMQWAWAETQQVKTCECCLLVSHLQDVRVTHPPIYTSLPPYFHPLSAGLMYHIVVCWKRSLWTTSVYQHLCHSYDGRKRSWWAESALIVLAASVFSLRTCTWSQRFTLRGGKRKPLSELWCGTADWGEFKGRVKEERNRGSKREMGGDMGRLSPGYSRG